MLHHVDEEPEKSINQILPTGRLPRQTAIQQFSIDFGQGHDSFHV
jgi:hypothetical protein